MSLRINLKNKDKRQSEMIKMENSLYILAIIIYKMVLSTKLLFLIYLNKIALLKVKTKL